MKHLFLESDMIIIMSLKDDLNTKSDIWLCSLANALTMLILSLLYVNHWIRRVLLPYILTLDVDFTL